LPFNMNTFYKLWGVKEPEVAKHIIEKQRVMSAITEPKNLEEQALKLVGRDIYEKLIKGYTEKQWGRKCADLPAFIIKRIPLRFTFDNNYFSDKYQGVPIGGYTLIIEKMLEGIEVRLSTDYFSFIKANAGIAKKTVYSGMLDEFFGYKYGALEYRSLRFETEELSTGNYQGVAVVNHTCGKTPYTRVIEHKHFEAFEGPEGFEASNRLSTVITREYPLEWSSGREPYYPLNDEKNNALYERYARLAAGRKDVIFGGRLGAYKYLDMDKAIEYALACSAKEFQFQFQHLEDERG